MKLLPMLSLLALSALTGYGNEEVPSPTPSPVPPSVIINNIYTVAPTPTPAPTSLPPVIVAPTPSPEEILTQEVAQFVINFIDAGSSSPYDEAAYYADYAVTYFDKGTLGKQAILKDIAQYDVRWPLRSYRIIEGPAVYWVNDRTAEAILIANFSVSNSHKSVSGTFKEKILIRVDMWNVISVDSQILDKVSYLVRGVNAKQ